MKAFRAVVVVKRPRGDIWAAIRDRLPAVAAQMPNVASVNQIERLVREDGTLCIVNEWRLRFAVPPGLRDMVEGELGWTDRSAWDESAYTCRWAIAPFFLANRLSCTGTTAFERALGGEGAKVTMEGTLALSSAALGPLSGPVAGIAELVLTTIIPKNLRSLVEAAGALGAEGLDQPISAP